MEHMVRPVSNMENTHDKMEKCSRIKCENYSKEKNLHPCSKCKKQDEKFFKEDWSGFSNHLTRVFNKMITKEK